VSGAGSGTGGSTTSMPSKPMSSCSAAGAATLLRLIRVIVIRPVVRIGVLGREYIRVDGVSAVFVHGFGHALTVGRDLEPDLGCSTDVDQEFDVPIAPGDRRTNGAARV
jgi:hypothetical protein